MSVLSGGRYIWLFECHHLFYSTSVSLSIHLNEVFFNAAQTRDASWDDRTICRRAGLLIVASLIYVLCYVMLDMYVSI